MTKTTKTKLQIIIGALVFTAFAVISCNNSGADKDAKKDSPAVEMKTPPPAVKDSMDTGDTKPTPDGN